MVLQLNHLQISLPSWMQESIRTVECIPHLENRMAFVIEAVRRNIAEKTGGPFAAAVFQIDSGKLVALGVNLVPTEQLSILHAEMVALSLAQKQLGHFDLGGKSLPAHELVTSTEPCAMCYGAVPWSGVRRLVTGATAADAQAVGFDEGPKLADWKEGLEQRGIEVVTDVLRDEAAAALREYRDGGGRIYNAREG